MSGSFIGAQSPDAGSCTGHMTPKGEFHWLDFKEVCTDITLLGRSGPF